MRVSSSAFFRVCAPLRVTRPHRAGLLCVEVKTRHGGDNPPPSLPFRLAAGGSARSGQASTTAARSGAAHRVRRRVGRGGSRVAAPTGTAARRVMTPGFEHQSTASHDGSERGTGSNSRRHPLPGRAARSTPGRSQEREALTIATMPAFIALGRSGHASTTAARSGSLALEFIAYAFSTLAFSLAVGGRIEPDSFGYCRDDGIERVPEDVGLTLDFFRVWTGLGG